MTARTHWAAVLLGPRGVLARWPARSHRAALAYAVAWLDAAPPGGYEVVVVGPPGVVATWYGTDAGWVDTTERTGT